jgi:hypothetical protein
MDEPTEIIVTALNRVLTFEDVDELAEHVQEILEHRYGIFDALECAAITKLAEVANGQADPEVHRLARRLTFYGPSRDERPPLPDEHVAKICEAEERLVDAETSWLEARHEHDRIQIDGRRAVGEARQAGGSRDEIDNRVAPLERRYAALLSEAVEHVARCREDLGRSRARVNALRVAGNSWRTEQAMTFHNADDPSKPLTLAELRARRGS